MYYMDIRCCKFTSERPKVALTIMTSPNVHVIFNYSGIIMAGERKTDLRLKDREFRALCEIVRAKKREKQGLKVLQDAINAILTNPDNQGCSVGPQTFFPDRDLSTNDHLQSPFIVAARHSEYEALSYFLDQFGDVIDVDLPAANCTAKIGHDVSQHKITLHGWTALNAACREECLSLKVVKLLVSRGASVNSRSCYGSSPLMGAASVGNVEVVEYLHKCGGDLHATNVMGQTPLCRAAAGGYHPVVQYLLNEGANADHRTLTGSTPLHLASSKGHLEAVRVLLAHGACPGFCTVDASRADYVPPPVFLAAFKGHREVVNELTALPECSLEVKVDALLLLGAAVFEDTAEGRAEVEKLWREALTIRESCTTPSVILPSSEAYSHRVEMCKLTDLESVLESPLEIRYQGLILYERCIGKFSLKGYKGRYLKVIKQLLKLQRHSEAEKLLIEQINAIASCQPSLPFGVKAYKFIHEICLWEKYLRTFAKILKVITESGKELSKPCVGHFVKFALQGLHFTHLPSLSPSCPKPSTWELVRIMLTFFSLCFEQQQKHSEKTSNPCVLDAEYESIGYDFVSEHLKGLPDTTVLHIALLQVSNFQLVSALLRWGADTVVNKPNASGSRPLHLAVQTYGTVEMVVLLLDHGAHVDAVDREGRTAIDMIAQWQHPVIQRTVLSAPLPLMCQACHILIAEGFPYEELDLPPHVKSVIRLHDKHKV